MLLALMVIVAASPQYDESIVSGVSVGPLTRKTSEASLKARFGEKAVVAREVGTGEGQCSAGTVLFPDDPARRMEIVWTTPAHDVPAFVNISGPAWHTASGVRVGSTLAELERLNGRPIVLNSFHMDYSGGLIDYQGGKLAGELTGLLVFTSPADPKADGPSESDLRSDQARVRAVQPIVDGIRVDFDTSRFDSHPCAPMTRH